MRILLTGANGYIGMRLLPILLELGHEVICSVRDEGRLSITPSLRKKIKVVELDFLSDQPIKKKLEKIDAAYYLIHSMSSSTKEFDELEAKSAWNFVRFANDLGVRQVIYLSGIVNEERLSKHLRSRKQVEDILGQGSFMLTTLRAGIIVGSGSASFEIIRDLCEKLPIMITPKWVLTKTQPIGIKDVISCLTGVLGRSDCLGKSYDIGGADIMTYRDMLKRYAKVRGFRNFILTVPIMTPRLSSYWLYFVTSTSYKLAVNLVDSMKMEVVARDNKLMQLLGIQPLTYEEAIRMAFRRIEQNTVLSSWKDSLVSGRFHHNLSEFVQVPSYGCLTDARTIQVQDGNKVLDRIWQIGGAKGWYYGNWLWKIRGFIDKLFGGVGLRRGRTHPDKIYPGDALDFWRVLLADKENKRLLLFAEMKVPGEAWLEWKLMENGILHQTATFRPKGLWGRLYWYSMLPFHHFIFAGMLRNLARP